MTNLVGQDLDGIHVILDLDATLVLALEDKRATLSKIGSPRRQPTSSKFISGVGASNLRQQNAFDIPSLGLRVNLRPGLVWFLDELFTHAATVSVWSAGSPEYVAAVANHLERMTGKPFYTVWSCEKCSKDDSGFPIKPLRTFIASKEGKAVGATKDNVVLVDDLIDNHKLNPTNSIMPPPYNEVNPYDYALYQVLYWIMHIINARRKGEVVLPGGEGEEMV